MTERAEFKENCIVCHAICGYYDEKRRKEPRAVLGVCERIC